MAKEPLTEISKTLKASDKAKKQTRDATGKFISVKELNSKEAVQSINKSGEYPPMVSVTVANPVTYLKLWWKKVWSGEGIDIKLRIHPVTAIVLALIICGAGFGLGRLTFPSDNPIVKYIPSLGPTPTVSPYKSAVYSGVVYKNYTTGKYYLLGAGEHVIVTLSFPDNVDPEKLVNKRILAEGMFNLDEQTFYVTYASDMEILPLTVSPVPTVLVSPTPIEEIPTPTIEQTPQEYDFEEPTL